MRLHILRVSVLTLLAFAMVTVTASAEGLKAPIKAGIIGLDAHGLPWTKIINNPEAEGELADMKVVAAFPGGSPDIEQSMSILKKSVKPVSELGVEIVGSIDELLKKVDVVLLLSIDGRTHLPQAKPVFAAGKPLFIDKPIAASLADTMRIFALSKKTGVPCFSSSSLRYAENTLDARTNAALGEVRGCDQYAPCSIEEHHPDFFWYGIHGVEPLFTIMGTGCKTVTRVHTEGQDVIVGVWNGGRIGTCRGIRDSRRGYGSTIFGTKAVLQAGKFNGYEPLIEDIVRFFKTGKAPVAEADTLEIIAFMEAADESKRQGGCPVTIESTMKKAREEVAKDK